MTKDIFIEPWDDCIHAHTREVKRGETSLFKVEDNLYSVSQISVYVKSDTGIETFKLYDDENNIDAHFTIEAGTVYFLLKDTTRYTAGTTLDISARIEYKSGQVDIVDLPTAVISESTYGEISDSAEGVIDHDNRWIIGSARDPEHIVRDLERRSITARVGDLYLNNLGVLFVLEDTGWKRYFNVFNGVRTSTISVGKDGVDGLTIQDDTASFIFWVESVQRTDKQNFDSVCLATDEATTLAALPKNPIYGNQEIWQAADSGAKAALIAGSRRDGNISCVITQGLGVQSGYSLPIIYQGNYIPLVGLPADNLESAKSLSELGWVATITLVEFREN